VLFWRKRAAADEWLEVFCDLVPAWRPIGWAEEKGPGYANLPRLPYSEV